MFKLIKRVRQMLKEEAEVSKAQRRLARVPLDYEFLETLINSSQLRGGVEMTVKLSDGTTITIKPMNAKETDFVSFKERYQKRNA